LEASPVAVGEQEGAEKDFVDLEGKKQGAKKWFGIW